MVGAIFAFVGAVTAAHYNIVANITQPSDSLDHKVDVAAKSFAERELKFPSEKDKKHVKREEIEKAIQDMANQQPPEMKFAVVSGRLIVGKSESITAALKGRRGVITVTLDSGSVVSVDAIKEKVCEEVNLDDKTQFKALVEAVYKRLDKIPIIVIEIEKGVTDPSVMKSAESFAKVCCWDNKFPCMVYIVPSDNASTDLLVQGQESRRKLIWVGPMTEDEGKQLLGKYPDFKMGDTGLKAIDEAAVADGEEGGYKELFKMVGTHPDDLKALAITSKDERQHFVDNLEEGGSMTWTTLIEKISSSADKNQKVADFDHLKVGMKNLSESLLNSGLEDVAVKDLKSPANEPHRVNTFMKETRIVPFIYHPLFKSYRFRTVFVERAARKWKEQKYMEELERKEAEELKRKEVEELKRKEAEELKRKEVEELKKKWWWMRPRN